MRLKKKSKKISGKFGHSGFHFILFFCLLLLLAFLGFLFVSKKQASCGDAQTKITNLTQRLAKLESELSAAQEKLTACEASYAKKVEIRKTSEGGYSFIVRGRPLVIKGVGYNPIPIGKGYDYDFFSDANKPWMVDGELMKEAGINCVRIYSAGEDMVQVAQFIRDMYETYGIYTIMSDWLGLWDWPRANYADKEFQEKTRERILKMVAALKNEPGLLMWILGNENNYTFSGKIGFWTSPEIEELDDLQKKQEKRAEIYYSFVDELAREIKKIDSIHPIALGNGEGSFLEIAQPICSNVDLLAIIAYRGKTFGNLFTSIKAAFDKPILLSEFGCDSYDAYKTTEDQEVQAEFLLSQWQDIYANTFVSGNQQGNVIGGCVFEWTDEWWKHNEGYTEDWSVHNAEAGWSHGAYFCDIRAKDNLNMNEEWFGMVSLSPELNNGINRRIPKTSYQRLKAFFLAPQIPERQ